LVEERYQYGENHNREGQEVEVNTHKEASEQLVNDVAELV